MLIHFTCFGLFTARVMRSALNSHTGVHCLAECCNTYYKINKIQHFTHFCTKSKSCCVIFLKTVAKGIAKPERVIICTRNICERKYRQVCSLQLLKSIKHANRKGQPCAWHANAFDNSNLKIPPQNLCVLTADSNCSQSAVAPLARWCCVIPLQNVRLTFIIF